MITINKEPGQRILELGCGSNPHPASDVRGDCRVCNDATGKRCVDFTVDLSEPLPIGSDEFDCVLSIFAFEHVPYPKLPGLIKETFRVLKPGGKTVIVVPNTEAQMKWIQGHPEGWDGKPLFESASCKLFGDQEHGERIGQADASVDSHKCYLNPDIVMRLFQEAGFQDAVVQPYGERATDMSVQASKPQKFPVEGQVIEAIRKIEKENQQVEKALEFATTVFRPVQTETNSPSTATVVVTRPPYDPAKTFDHSYFNGIGYKPFYWDYPCHEVTARHVLARRPESVLELGCGRGYVLKRLQDSGVVTAGVDISRHCQLTSVANDVSYFDLIHEAWLIDLPKNDLCFSQAFLEHVPEDKLPDLFHRMSIFTKRGLHGITFVERAERDDGSDPTRVTLRSRQWWQERMPKGHEVVAKNELEDGPLPLEVAKGDGKVKLNIGCCMTMFHHGWQNIDCLDLAGFAQQWGYNYQVLDVRAGLPHATQSVDMIFASHFLEHLSYGEAKAFLNDCRRAIRPDGLIRLVVPDANVLLHRFQDGQLGEFDEANEGCRTSKTQAGKLWHLLSESHKAQYDADTLCSLLHDCGFDSKVEGFRTGSCPQLLAESLEYHYGYSLVVEARPTCK